MSSNLYFFDGGVSLFDDVEEALFELQLARFSLLLVADYARSYLVPGYGSVCSDVSPEVLCETLSGAAEFVRDRVDGCFYAWKRLSGSVYRLDSDAVGLQDLEERLRVASSASGVE